MIHDEFEQPTDHFTQHITTEPSPFEPPCGPGNSTTSLAADMADPMAIGTVAELLDRDDDLLPSLADLRLRTISWWSPYRIGSGLLHIFEGDVESALDEVLVDVIAARSTGRALPEGDPEGAETVLFLSLGHDFETYYGPLLDAADAERKRIIVGGAYSFPADFERLKRVIRRQQVDVVVIPNVFTHLSPGINPSFDFDSWPVIRGFKEVMAETGVTIILTRGLLKNAAKLESLHRGIGALGWTEAADVVLAVTRDSDWVTIETVRLKHGRKPAPLHAEIMWSSEGSRSRLDYRLDRDLDGAQEPQVAVQQERAPKRTRRTSKGSRVAPN